MNQMTKIAFENILPEIQIVANSICRKNGISCCRKKSKEMGIEYV